jgi:hypothetical protein
MHAYKVFVFSQREQRFIFPNGFGVGDRHLHTSAYVSIRQHTSAYVSILERRFIFPNGFGVGDRHLFFFLKENRGEACGSEALSSMLL